MNDIVKPKDGQAVSQEGVLVGEEGPTSAGWHHIQTFLECPKKFQLEKVRKVRVPMRSTPPHFIVGGLVHAGRAAWFARRFATDESTMFAVKEAIHVSFETRLADETPAPSSKLALAEALDITRQYIEFWAVRPLPRPVAVEFPVQGLLAAGGADGRARTARLDDVSFYPEAEGRLCIGELKTTSDLSSTFTEYSLHGQPALQNLLWEKSPLGAAVHGSAAGTLLDVVQKGYGAEKCRFARRFSPWPDFFLAWFEKNLHSAVELAAKVTWDSGDDEAPRRITSCTKMVGRRRVQCQFASLCLNGRDAALEYVLEDGKRLLEHTPSEGQRRMPWE